MQVWRWLPFLSICALPLMSIKPLACNSCSVRRAVDSEQPQALAIVLIRAAGSQRVADAPVTVEMYESKQRLGSEDAPDSPPRYTAAAPVKPCVPFLRMSGTQHQPTEKRRHFFNHVRAGISILTSFIGVGHLPQPPGKLLQPLVLLVFVLVRPPLTAKTGICDHPLKVPNPLCGVVFVRQEGACDHTARPATATTCWIAASGRCPSDSGNV